MIGDGGGEKRADPVKEDRRNEREYEGQKKRRENKADKGQCMNERQREGKCRKENRMKKEGIVEDRLTEA